LIEGVTDTLELATVTPEHALALLLEIDKG
jgi:hypothetical protein